MDKPIISNDINNLESRNNYYSRIFPSIFERALNAEVFDSRGTAYIDFFSCAGSINYGHNNPALVNEAISHLKSNKIINALDLETVVKTNFLNYFSTNILNDDSKIYRYFLPGPTGTNAIESAIKIARLSTGRKNIACFTNSFHGMTLGSLALTGNMNSREAAGIDLSAGVMRFPYDGYHTDLDSLAYIEHLLSDPSSGFEKPAAFILETIQGEGGLNVASNRWLEGLSALSKSHGALLIIDDIQAGCGRTGEFFSFDINKVKPDIICLSKSLSGIGLPMSMVILNSKHDVSDLQKVFSTFSGINP